MNIHLFDCFQVEQNWYLRWKESKDYPVVAWEWHQNYENLMFNIFYFWLCFFLKISIFLFYWFFRERNFWIIKITPFLVFYSKSPKFYGEEFWNCETLRIYILFLSIFLFLTFNLSFFIYLFLLVIWRNLIKPTEPNPTQPNPTHWLDLKIKT